MATNANCGVCTAENPADFTFCHHCGAAPSGTPTAAKKSAAGAKKKTGKKKRK